MSRTRIIMNEIHSSIRRVTEQLDDLLRQLSNSQATDTPKLIEDTLTIELMANFKSAVDAMRHLLWIYIEAASRAASGDINDPIHGPRLRSATEILRALREDGVPLSRNFPGGHSFIEHVETLLAYYSQQEGAKKEEPLPASSRKAVQW